MDHQPPRPNHKERDHVGYPQTDPSHTRKASANSKCNGPVMASTRQTAGRGQASRQVIKPQDDDGSLEGESRTIPYQSSNLSGPTPPGTPPIATIPLSPTTPMTPMTPMTPSRHLTDEQILVDVYHFINEEMEPGGLHALCFQRADDRPPITPESLAELDMPRIINNPKLRHDVNFDRELHFRPNLDGSKGKQKIFQAGQYWKALEAELVIHNVALTRKASQFSPITSEYWDRIAKASLVRLPKIFSALRDILKTLVPDYDQKPVQERLDVDHLMQEIRNGACDLIDLAGWLAKILKNHCAPMRDPLVDCMREEIERGARENKPEKLVSGLRKLMDILEVMKLDVANHQIRHMRPLLIDDTINFQKRYNTHRIAIGKIDAMSARGWLWDNVQPLGFEPSPLRALTRGLIHNLLYKDSSSFCPATFYLDSDRLRTLRVELHSRVYHGVCRDILREIASETMAEADLQRACQQLDRRAADIVGAHGKFADRLENLAAEIVHQLLVAEGRYPPFDADLVCLAEQKLAENLRQDCPAFEQNAAALAEELTPKIQARVHDLVKVSALDLQDMLVPPSMPPPKPAVGFGAVCEPLPSSFRSSPIDPDEDIIRRFAHISALHWQVWADLVYLAEFPESDDDVASKDGSDSTMVQSQASSPTVPVAQAVYAPGHQWLPASVTVADVPIGLPTPSPSPKPEGDSASNGEQGEDAQSPKQRQPA